MKRLDFQEAVRRLHCTDMADLIDAGAGRFGIDDDMWRSFRANPGNFMIRADDETADIIWGVITEGRPFRGETEA